MEKSPDPIALDPDILVSTSVDEKTPALPLDASDLTDIAVAEMPEPTSSGAIPSPSVSSIPADKPFSLENPPLHVEQKDDAGTSFDPSIHKIDADGHPIRERGKFVRAKRGRPSKSAESSPRPTSDASAKSKIPDVSPSGSGASAKTSEDAAQEGARDPQPSGDEKFEAQTEVVLGIAFGFGAAMFGKDFYPDNKEEADIIRKPTFAFIKEKNGIPLTTGQALCVAILGYGIMKYQKPTVQERMVMWYLRVRNWFSKK